MDPLFRPDRGRLISAHRHAAHIASALMRSVSIAFSVAVLLSGCTPEAAPPAEPSGQGTSELSVTTDESAPQPSALNPQPSTTSELAVTTDESGRKWLTAEIPYDVFPDLPSAAELIASHGDRPDGPIAVGISSADQPTETPLANVPAPTGEMPAAPAEEPDGQTVASANSTLTSPAATEMAIAATNWGTILPVQVLDDEISAVRNRLQRDLLTVGSFNRDFADVERDGWEMSALATIAAEHPDEFSWKPNALLARDAAISIAQAATGRGRENFKKAELGGEQVSAVLNNNVPAGMDAPKTDLSRDKTADRAALMARVQIAYDRLREQSTNEAALRENADALNRQSRVLAALGKFVAHSDYGGAENDDYQAAAKQLVDAALGMTQATADEDLAAFQSAWTQAGAACTACHNKYR